MKPVGIYLDAGVRAVINEGHNGLLWHPARPGGPS
jgi:hypothetical protein